MSRRESFVQLQCSLVLTSTRAMTSMSHEDIVERRKIDESEVEEDDEKWDDSEILRETVTMIIFKMLL